MAITGNTTTKRNGIISRLAIPKAIAAEHAGLKAAVHGSQYHF
jgi:hypothetical protein